MNAQMSPHWLNEDEMKKLGKEQSGWEGPSKCLVKYNKLWYFYDETWSNLFGPFKEKDSATEAVMLYSKSLNKS
jgi:hypothetical protein